MDDMKHLINKSYVLRKISIKEIREMKLSSLVIEIPCIKNLNIICIEKFLSNLTFFHCYMLYSNEYLQIINGNNEARKHVLILGCNETIV